ncbi:MAG TPA: polyprenyl synthetase [Armatimonadetes bacterium]|jgi:geranylgeranyl pyrophosphate synthase|nr:polyprenyl synthetase [Armatimonadota bacterium]
MEHFGEITAADSERRTGSEAVAAPSPHPDDVKLVPPEPHLRAAIRRAALECPGNGPGAGPMTIEDIQARAGGVLTRLQLPDSYLGFAMVCVDNTFWATDFASVPFERRLLLLPKCLRNVDACVGEYDAVGLHCAECGACALAGLKQDAERLGYDVIIAEGTSSAVLRVLEGRADAILGVACLDSLDRSFERISDLGIPHQAVPLLTDGCINTTAEVDLIRELICTARPGDRLERVSWLPLLRATQDVFEPGRLAEAIGSCCSPPVHDDTTPAPLAATDHIAREWLSRDGKRLRPFVTIAAYAMARHGLAGLAPGADTAALAPEPVRRVALAIETLHKASLIHDDIEDGDTHRYGQPTVHHVHGVGTAINVGDYLVGLGYRLIADQTDHLGAACVADILRRLSAAHMRLCSGQGAELQWNSRPLRPIDALQIGALKTAPAFEIALYAGLRAAETHVDEDLLRRLATYIGEGFQVLNDLDDWDERSAHRRPPGHDIITGRPTILRAFAEDAGGAEQLELLFEQARSLDDHSAATARVRDLYKRCGAFEKARALHSRLREGALRLAEEMPSPALRELARFLVRSILKRPTGTHTGG